MLRRKFDPEDCLATVARYRCDSLVVVPVMMQRILELPEETRAKYDVSSLKVVAASGSALPGDLATDWMDAVGDTLYNLYGSTEVAWASIATPEDMRAAPGTAGRPPRGTLVKLYDEAGEEVPPGQPGRIFVTNEMLFEGYTGGGTKDVIGAFMSTGDVGRFDADGRLFVEGRDDEMIVSGARTSSPRRSRTRSPATRRYRKRRRSVSRTPTSASACAPSSCSEQGREASEDDLKAHVKQNLARYKVPREIWFLDELPRNATGKVLKRELRELDEPEAAAGDAKEG